MLKENKNQSGIVPSGFEKKQDWSSAYRANYPTVYRNELMKRCKIHKKNDSLKRIFDSELFEECKLKSQERQLICVDLLSAYGDAFLAIVNGMTSDEIYEAWSSDRNSINIENRRRFNCKTVGVDISENALKYTKLAGIFDEVVQTDINQMSQEDRKLLSEYLRKSDIVHSGSPGYMSLESFRFTVDSFAKGSDNFGYFIVSFNNIFMKFHKEFKRYILDQLHFIDCTGGFQRNLLPDEEEYYGLSQVYNTTWIMKR
ncbi:MAG: hypothetical protein SVX43_08495 [Cyanobacteriota bacterium]|nr:hypothetical protein [Cyanobacteriota bacterium]